MYIRTPEFFIGNHVALAALGAIDKAMFLQVDKIIENDVWPFNWCRLIYVRVTKRLRE